MNKNEKPDYVCDAARIAEEKGRRQAQMYNQQTGSDTNNGATFDTNQGGGAQTQSSTPVKPKDTPKEVSQVSTEVKNTEVTTETSTPPKQDLEVGQSDVGLEKKSEESIVSPSKDDGKNETYGDTSTKRQTDVTQEGTGCDTTQGSCESQNEYVMWGTIPDEYSGSTMQDHKKEYEKKLQELEEENKNKPKDQQLTPEEKGIINYDTKMNNSNLFSKVGCKMQAAAKFFSSIGNKFCDILDVNDKADVNKDGLLTQKEIENQVLNVLDETKELKTDYFEKTLSREVLDNISKQSGTTYVLGRAENVHGGQHWVVLEGYKMNERNQVEFIYSPTSCNDTGRHFVLGDPLGQSNYYTISKIEVYQITDKF